MGSSSDPSNSPHLPNTTRMKVILMLCVLAVCLLSIKAEDAKCTECCQGTTAAPTSAASSTAAPTGASSTVTVPSKTSAKTSLTSKQVRADTTTGAPAPDTCDGYNTVALCDEKYGAATFAMSVAFVLASVIMALHV